MASPACCLMWKNIAVIKPGHRLIDPSELRQPRSAPGVVGIDFTTEAQPIRHGGQVRRGRQAVSAPVSGTLSEP